MSRQEVKDGPERHPLNPEVVRGPNRIWGEDQLSVQEWEAPHHRVVLTPELQDALVLDQPVLRWSQRKRLMVLSRHSRDQPVIEALDACLAEWKFAGIEVGKNAMWRVLFVQEGRWYSSTFGRDLTGSLNLITVFGGSQRSFLQNRLNGMTGVVVKSDFRPGGGSGIS